MGSGVYEYVCGGSLGDVRNFFLTFSFLFLFISWNHFLFYVLVGFFFFKDSVIFYVLFPFPVNICLVFGLRGLGPKEGALSQTTTRVSHVTHVTLLLQILDPNWVIPWKSLS